MRHGLATGLQWRAARLTWLMSMLVLLLQRTPVLRMLVHAEFAVGPRAGQILRAMLPVAATLGAAHTLTGQSMMVINPDPPVAGTVGQPLAVAFAFTGGPVTPESYAIVGVLPPGMTVPGATGPANNRTLNGFLGTIEGTPTTAGTYNVSVEAFDGPNLTQGTYGSSGPTVITFNIASGTSPPAFTTHPQTQAANVGVNVTFTVVVTGQPPPTLQWRKGTDDIPGATGLSLTLNNVTLADAGSYTCVATNSQGAQTSNAATLTVNVPPAFTTQPATQTVVEGGSVTFTVAVTGTPPPTLQWRKDGNPIAGQTGLSLTINPVAVADAGTYDCVATNAGGNATSDPATLTVHTTPFFTTNPSSQTLDYGGSATFTVAVTGIPPPTLQWRKDGAPLSGETGTSLTISPLVLADGGSYDCVATNVVAAVPSSPAQLTVTPPPAPGLMTAPIPMTSLTGSGAFFAVLATGVDVTYQWRKDGVDLPGRTQSSLFIASATGGDAGSYSVVVSNPGGTFETTQVALTIATTGRARLANLSARAQIGTGGDILIPGFIVGGSGTKTVLVRAIGPKLDDFGVGGFLADPTIQLFRGQTAGELNDDWQLFANQILLEDTRLAVGAFALQPSAQPLKDSSMVVSLDAGEAFTVKAEGVGATTGVGLVELYDADPSSTTSRFVNISARAVVGTGGDILIPGFIIEGDVALTLLIRGVGPKLLDPPYNVTGVLADPVITLFRITDFATGASEPMTDNDDWGDAPDPAAMENARVATFAFAFNDGSTDAALLVALPPGGYTVKVEGKNQTTGVGLMEIYLVGP